MFRGGRRFSCRVFPSCTQFHEVLLWLPYAMLWAQQNGLWQGVLAFQSCTWSFQSRPPREQVCSGRTDQLISHTYPLSLTWMNICSNSLLIFTQRVALCACCTISCFHTLYFFPIHYYLCACFAVCCLFFCCRPLWKYFAPKSHT